MCTILHRLCSPIIYSGLTLCQQCSSVLLSVGCGITSQTCNGHLHPEHCWSRTASVCVAQRSSTFHVLRMERERETWNLCTYVPGEGTKARQCWVCKPLVCLRVFVHRISLDTPVTVTSICTSNILRCLYMCTGAWESCTRTGGVHGGSPVCVCVCVCAYDTAMLTTVTVEDCNRASSALYSSSS